MFSGRGIKLKSVSLYLHDHVMERLRKDYLVSIDFPEFVAVVAHKMRSGHHEAGGTIGQLVTAWAAEGNTL